MDTQAQAAVRRAIGMLEAILKRQIALHRQMLEVAGRKQDSIVNGDLAALEKEVAEEKRLVAEIEDEERRRQAVMPAVKSGLGLAASAEKLGDIIPAMPEPERENLAGIRAELKAVLEQVQLKSRHNAELLKASLEHVDAFLRSLAEASAPDANYRKDGRRAGGGPTMIDRSA